MRCVIDDDLATFAAATASWVEREPVLNNVLGTLIGSRLSGEVPLEPGCFWVRILHGDELVGVAVRTPPHPLLVSAFSPAAAEALAGALAGTDLPGVQGPTAAVLAFAATWQARTGCAAKEEMKQRMHRLDAVTAPTGVAGALRVATAADHPLAAQWMRAFTEITHGPRPSADEIATQVRQFIDAGHLFLWEVDGVPVSMAGHRTPVLNVPRVAEVYTPPEHRRHGYAEACVAALSQLLLDRGADACMLYTDLGNPTSNAIYQRIGYRPHAEAEAWSFKA